MDALVLPMGRNSSLGDLDQPALDVGTPGCNPLSPTGAAGVGASPRWQGTTRAPWTAIDSILGTSSGTQAKQSDPHWLGVSLSSTDPVHAYSTPNLAIFNAAACATDGLIAPRSSSFSMPSQGAGPVLTGNVSLQLAQLQQAGISTPAAGHNVDMGLSPRFGASMSSDTAPVSTGTHTMLPSAAAMCAATQQQQLLELAGAMAAQVSAGSTAETSSAALLHRLLAAVAGADSTYSKLQVLEELQTVIAQQQQQLQLQLRAQQVMSSAAGYDDLMQARDQSVTGALSTSLGGMTDTTGGGLLSAAAALGQLQHDALAAGCDPLADTPTALAALPPGLLEDVVGIDAPASMFSQLAMPSARCSSSSSSGSSSSSAGCAVSRLEDGHAAAQYGGGFRTCSRLARASSVGGVGGAANSTADSSSGSMATSLSALHQQLHQAIEQLENLHISANASTSGAPAGPPMGSSLWEWDAVASLLRGDSLMRGDSLVSRGSINRSGSGITSDSSGSSTLWMDAGSAGALLPAAVLGLQSFASTGGLLPPLGSSVGAALQRTRSNVSCSSTTSAGGTGTPRGGTRPLSGAPRGATRNSSSCGGRPNMDPAVQGMSIARSSSTGGRQGRTQNASVDSLLQQCAPKWAKAGWNPKANVTAVPATSKGTGAFVRLNTDDDNSTASKSAAPEIKLSIPVSNTPESNSKGGKGTGAFIPPAVRAAVAAAAGLT